ncbi:MAG TPA: hypothetical protein VFH19_01295 [Nitrososphaeraceae archaeon]|nr:hypothetical protein [Nitrososphaeraceae archaeon]
MSIEKRQPTQEFYSALDDVIAHQIKSREAFDKAIEIGRKQGYDDFTIGLFIKDYLKEKIPKTSLYRYLKELNPNENSVPREQIYYNNVLEQKDTQKDTSRYEDIVLDKVEGFDSIEKYILDTARLFERLGYTEDKIITETKRLCKSGGMGQAELEHVDYVLHWKYDTYRKLDEGLRNTAPSMIQYIKIAVNLMIYGIPKDKISAKIKEIAIPIQGIEESHFIDLSLQATGTFTDPSIPEADYLGEYINSILPREHGGYVDDEVYKAEQAEKEIGIGDGRKYNADENYCRHCIKKQKNDFLIGNLTD